MNPHGKGPHQVWTACPRIPSACQENPTGQASSHASPNHPDVHARQDSLYSVSVLPMSYLHCNQEQGTRPPPVPAALAFVL